MAFFEDRFPECVSFGARGGPGWSTSVARQMNGRRVANKNREYPLHQYEAAHGVKTSDDFEAVRAFFFVVAGRFDGFRYKDWADYQAASGQGVIVTVGGAKRLARRYTFGARSYDRLITKPVSGTVAITGGGSLDYTTGIITGGSPTAWTGEFDVPVNFMDDLLAAEIVDRQNDGQFFESWSSIRLEEVPV